MLAASRAGASATSPPEGLGRYWYATEQTESRPLPHYVRFSKDGTEARRDDSSCRGPLKESVLDMNALVEVLGADISLRDLKLSSCGRRAACILEQVGQRSQVYLLWLPAPRLQPLTRPELRRVRALEGAVALDWLGDARQGLCATLADASGRAAGVALCDPDATEAVLTRICQEPDPAVFVHAARSRDGSALVVSRLGKASSEVWIGGTDEIARQAKLRIPNLESSVGEQLRACGFSVLVPWQRGCETYADVAQPWAYALSNWERAGEGMCVYRTSMEALASGRPPQPTLVYRPPEEESLEDIVVTRHGIVLCGRRRAVTPMLCVVKENERDGESPTSTTTWVKQDVPLPPWALHASLGVNADFESSLVRVKLSSPAELEQAWDWDVELE
ncbi:hypothetical protein H632_c1753p0, partial [Helicosporidium sp. ATCC 50920]